MKKFIEDETWLKYNIGKIVTNNFCYRPSHTNDDQSFETETIEQHLINVDKYTTGESHAEEEEGKEEAEEEEEGANNENDDDDDENNLANNSNQVASTSNEILKPKKAVTFKSGLFIRERSFGTYKGPLISIEQVGAFFIPFTFEKKITFLYLF